MCGLAAAEISSTTTTAAASASATTAAAVIAEIPARAVESAAAAATTTARRTVFAGTCFVDGQRAAVKFLAVKSCHSSLCLGVRAHRDEGEAAGAAGEFVLHQHDFRNGAALREQVLDGDLGRVERQIADI